MAGAARVSEQRRCRELPLIAQPVAVDDEPRPDMFALVAGDQLPPCDACELDNHLDLVGIERARHPERDLLQARVGESGRELGSVRE